MTWSPLFDLVCYELSAQVLLNPVLDALKALQVAERFAAMDPWLTLGYKTDTLANYLVRVDPCLHRYVIEYEERVSGVVCIRYPWLRGPYIELLGLFAEAQGQGIGSAVIDWVLRRTQDRERNVWIMVSSFNASARHFYTSKGFYQVADIPDLVKQGTEDKLFRKVLKPLSNTGQQMKEEV